MKHKTIDEVRQTIRNAILMEKEFASAGFLTPAILERSRGSLEAFQHTLAWLADLGDES